MNERLIVVAGAVILDMLFGDPVWLYHPVRAMGKCIEICEKFYVKLFGIKKTGEEDKYKKLAAGVLIVFSVTAFSVGVVWWLLSVVYKLNHYAGLILQCVICYELIAIKDLKRESMRVYYDLKNGDVKRARKDLSMIVGRDTENLDSEGITKAAVETVAENTSDGVIAPLLFIMLFGALGGVFYKAVNTMDSIIGYKNDRYIYLGRAAARLDDAVNFIPSRISALIMIISAFILRFDGKNAVKIFIRDRYKHKSPNSAQTEAVCAGALGVELGGSNYYFGKLVIKPVIGEKKRNIVPYDIVRVNRLMYCTAVLCTAAGCICMILL